MKDLRSDLKRRVWIQMQVRIKSWGGSHTRVKLWGRSWRMMICVLSKKKREKTYPSASNPSSRSHNSTRTSAQPFTPDKCRKKKNKKRIQSTHINSQPRHQRKRCTISHHSQRRRTWTRFTTCWSCWSRTRNMIRIYTFCRCLRSFIACLTSIQSKAKKTHAPTLSSSPSQFTEWHCWLNNRWRSSKGSSCPRTRHFTSRRRSLRL